MKIKIFIFHYKKFYFDSNTNSMNAGYISRSEDRMISICQDGKIWQNKNNPAIWIIADLMMVELFNKREVWLETT